MARRLSYIYIALLAASLLACNRNGQATKSGIVIRTPQRVRTILPSNNTVCFAINLRMDTQTAIMQNACTLASALNSAWVAPGQDISLNPKSGSYWVDLYVYLDPNQGKCPTSWDAITGAMSPSMIANVYPAGTYSSVVKIVEGTPTTITMNDGYNGTNLIAAQSLPGACTSGAIVSAPSSYSLGAGAQVLTGSGIQITAKLQTSGQVLSGTGIQLIAK